MGYQVSWMAAKTAKATLLTALGMTDTGVPDEANDAPFSVAELPGGWSLVWANDLEWANPSRLAGLAATTPVVTFMVMEGISASSVAYAGPDGLWQVAYGVEEDGALSGEWPAALAPVAMAATDPFDIPVDLALAVTGYEYSRSAYDWGQVRFTEAKGPALATRQVP